MLVNGFYAGYMPKHIRKWLKDRQPHVPDQPDIPDQPDTPDEPTNIIVNIPIIEKLTYTGAEQSIINILANEGYKIEGQTTATNVDTYTVTATLNEGYVWSDGSFDNKTIEWSIIKADNEWEISPTLIPNEWREDLQAGTLTKGKAKFGGDTIMKLGDETITELPTSSGDYTLTFIVEGNDNYTALSETINFKIIDRLDLNTDFSNLGPLTYSGTEQSIIISSETDNYVVDGTITAIDANEYSFTITPKDGYEWPEGTAETRTYPWQITQAENGWKDDIKPAISKSSWYENDTDPGILNTYESIFGIPYIKLNNEIITELPTAPNNYTIEIIVDENKNYTGLSETISFEILKYEEPVLPDMPNETDITIDPNYGEVKTGLGENGDEVAVIFKNTDVDNIQWTVPSTIISAEFLAVGGGGGGGGGAQYGATTEINRGGAGGGGGGVITGYINVLPKDSMLNIVIGKGGIGGEPTALTSNGAGKAPDDGGIGGSTILYVNDTFYLSAYGGGRDLGRNKKGGIGGSHAGSRIDDRSDDLTWKDTAINESVISNGETYGNLGGKAPGATAKNGVRAGGGGGGAMSEGGNSAEAANKSETGGGAGGAGLSSYITGELKVYGSGGGGGDGNTGKGGLGGIGAGDGGYGYDESNGGDAVANQGGGGGGCGRGGAKNNPPGGKGGNGGSGIFILRFKVNKQEEPDTPDTPVDPDTPDEPTNIAINIPEPTQTSFEFNNNEQSIGIQPNKGYTIEGPTSATDAGEYTVTLKLNEGYVWSDGSFDDKTIEWSITKVNNTWTTKPYISKTEWTEGDTSVTLTNGVDMFGNNAVMMLGDKEIKELPTESGEYTLTFIVEENDNYTGLSETISFKILKPEVIEPEEIDLNFNLEHGEVKTGLGENSDEVAVIFKNADLDTMNWTVPCDLENVEFLAVGGGGGGGGAANATTCGAGGAGGGAGCVVTGTINSILSGDTINITVGKGGTGGKYTALSTDGTGKANNGLDSYLGINNNVYISAFGGAGDNGYNTAVLGGNNSTGGSNPGARTKIKTAVSINNKDVWNSTLLSNTLTNVLVYRNKGGHNDENGSYNGHSSAGGGGAMAVGHFPTTSNVGGYGGIGLLTNITGNDVYYGSGGGGGGTKGSESVSYYPDGIYRDDEVINIWGSGRGVSNGNGENALPNQGGGGGGGGKAGNGGNGGSGIIILRFKLANKKIKFGSNYPVNYSTVPVVTTEMKELLALSNTNLANKFLTAHTDDNPNQDRLEIKDIYEKENSIPVELKWLGGDNTKYSISLWRTNIDSEENPLFTTETTDTSVKFYDLEVGRNYSWTVTDNSGEKITRQFFTEENDPSNNNFAPRIIRSYQNELSYASCTNGRDLGGYITTNVDENGNKLRIKQGLIFRSGMFEFCNLIEDGDKRILKELSQLKNNLKIKLDLDLRKLSEFDYFIDYIPEWKTKDTYNIYTDSIIGEGITRISTEKETGLQFTDITGMFSGTSMNNSRKVFWFAFNKIYESIMKNEPVIFHCSHGKDRTGVLAFVILCYLGVSSDVASNDFIIAWATNQDTTITLSELTSFKTKIKALDPSTDKTTRDGCKEFLKLCGNAAGETDSNIETILNNFKAKMLEIVETKIEDENKLTKIKIPEFPDLEYTGEELSIPTNNIVGYTVSGQTSAINVGTYNIKVSLNDKYIWNDDSLDDKEISWQITKAANVWKTNSTLSKPDWYEDGENPGILTEGVAKFGTVNIKYATIDGEEIESFPTTAGKYVINITVDETTNYTGISEIIEFEIFEKIKEPINPLTFTSTGDSKIQLIKEGEPNPISLEYIIENNEPSKYAIGDEINLTDGQKLKLYAVNRNNSFSNDYENYYHFKMSGDIAASGNIQTLLHKAGQKIDLKDLNCCYINLFANCSCLTTPPELPATTLAENCYDGMFYNCTALTTSPELPAETLAASCYANMFMGCESLLYAPILKAKKLENNCYVGMFFDCYSLTSAPELPAETLATGCYVDMFTNCVSLIESPELPATELKEYCYLNMFAGCKKIIHAKPIKGMNYVTDCYAYMFDSCLSLLKMSFPNINADSFINIVANQNTFLYAANNIEVNCKDRVVYINSTEDDLDNPLTFTSVGNTSFKLTNTENTLFKQTNTENTTTNNSYIEYKYIEDSDWKNYILDTPINLIDGQRVMFRASDDKDIYTFSQDLNNYYQFIQLNDNGNIIASGNIHTLLEKTGQMTIAPKYCFNNLFNNFTILIQAPKLNAEAVSEYCYSNMFANCSSLTSMPELPATTLAEGCYESMFANCNLLKNTTKLDAKLLEKNCYSNMFANCTSLINAPELQSTALAESCYEGMFTNCSSLVNAPELPATTLKTDCYKNMFNGCNSLINAPKLNATIFDNISDFYLCMFNNCTSLLQIYFSNLQSVTVLELINAQNIFNNAANNIKIVCTDQTIIINEQEQPAINPLTFNSSGNSTVKLNKIGNPSDIKLEYAINNGNIISDNTIYTGINLQDGDTLIIHATSSGNKTFSLNQENYYQFEMSGIIYASGNINSLLDKYSADNITTIPAYCYYSLFANCTSLINAPELPATTLGANCYQYMFMSCTQLITAPSLSNIKRVGEYSCASMFINCSNLISLIELPATNLADYCYENMFKNCEKLVIAPKLYAAELYYACYRGMFENCTSLKTAPEILATDVEYAPYCCANMFMNCTALVNGPILFPETLSKCCYYYMFYGCKSLEHVTLITETLANECCDYMFNYCTNENLKITFTNLFSNDIIDLAENNNVFLDAANNIEVVCYDTTVIINDTTAM